MSASPLARLHDFGQSFWWDSLSRKALDDGTIVRLRDEDGMRGITSNPSIFQAAIAGSNDYDAAVRELAAAGDAVEDIFWKLAVRDIQDACEQLRPVYESSGGEDGYVSLEVDPRLAHDTARTSGEVERLWNAGESIRRFREAVLCARARAPCPGGGDGALRR